jgi:hypothetical protein
VTARDACPSATRFIIGILIVFIAVVIIPRMRLAGGVNAATLGWMSEQWLAERASHSP